jgi:hypothetical protein
MLIISWASSTDLFVLDPHVSGKLHPVQSAWKDTTCRKRAKPTILIVRTRVTTLNHSP